MSQSTNVQALIALLDDTDQEVYTQVANEILQLGPNVIPSLEVAWHTRPEPILQTRVERLIHKIQFDLVKDELTEWKDHNGYPISEALVILARYAYPDFDAQECLNRLNKLKQDIWLEFNYDLTPLDETHVFNQVFYGHHGYKGKTRCIKETASYYINNLLRDKKGNPHSMGLLYLCVAQMMKMPLMAVCLPYYFILARLDDYYEDLVDVTEENVLFYIDPFNKGAVFSKNEIMGFLKKSRIEPQASYFMPSSNITAIFETLKHIQQLYGEQGKDRQVDDFNDLMDLLEK